MMSLQVIFRKQTLKKGETIVVVFDFHPSPPSTCCLGKQAALLLTFNCLGSSYAVYYISGKKFALEGTNSHLQETIKLLEHAS